MFISTDPQYADFYLAYTEVMRNDPNAFVKTYQAGEGEAAVSSLTH